MELHYGRDDFADQGKLARTLSRDRPKDNALDYDAAAERFGARRSVERSRILDTLAKEPLAEPPRQLP